jgi:hypothetical protein
MLRRNCTFFFWTPAADLDVICISLYFPTELLLSLSLFFYGFLQAASSSGRLDALK